ncbi:uncharacterized protein LOC125863805 [Solanum stenotomum]|uniref:uncharacterized protein LOC125863805 n=1 Tax=Solanum stenotomum TaxID=172797 RepID=UPI0020D12BA6|nr:uncharacterized protein LOC125863805 [Solanum stenotomum]
MDSGSEMLTFSLNNGGKRAGVAWGGDLITILSYSNIKTHTLINFHSLFLCSLEDQRRQPLFSHVAPPARPSIADESFLSPLPIALSPLSLPSFPLFSFRREITPAPTSGSNRQQPAAGEEGGAASKAARLMLLLFPSHFQRSSNSSRRRHQLQPVARRDTARTSNNNCSGQQSGGTNSNINNSGEARSSGETHKRVVFVASQVQCQHWIVLYLMTKMFLKKKTLLNGKLCKVKLILMLQFNYMALQRYLLEQQRWDVVNAKGNLLFMPSRFEHKFKIWRASIGGKH